MKFILLLSLFVLCLTSVEGQQFSITGKLNYIQDDEHQYTDQYMGYEFPVMMLNDSMYIRTNYLYTTTYERLYTPDFGGEITGKVAFELFDNLSLRSGLGLNYMSFGIDSKHISTTYEYLGMDTLKISSGTPGIISFGCDSFKNSYSDIAPLKKGITQQLLNLVIPLELEYNLLHHRLFLRGGAYLQTPIYSSTDNESIRIESEVTNGIEICEYVKVENHNTSGNSLNHLQFGATANLAYRLSNSLNIELGISKDLSNTFSKEEYQIYPLKGDEFKPLKFSLGIEYFFNHSYNVASDNMN